MRAQLLALLAAISFAAYAEDPVKPDIGAGPHSDRAAQPPGEGTRHDSVPPQAPRPSAGSSAAPSTPDDSHADHMRREDEKKATESKQKMKRRPGYKEDVPAPRG